MDKINSKQDSIKLEAFVKHNAVHYKWHEPGNNNFEYLLALGKSAARNVK